MLGREFGDCGNLGLGRRPRRRRRQLGTVGGLARGDHKGGEVEACRRELQPEPDDHVFTAEVEQWGSMSARVRRRKDAKTPGSERPSGVSFGVSASERGSGR